MGKGGAEGQTRTVDTGIFSAVLYHLSYLGGLIYLKSAFICCQVRFSRRPPHFNHSRQLARQLANAVSQPCQAATSGSRPAPAQGAARQGAGVLAPVDDHPAVDDYVLDADGVMLGVFPGGVGFHRVRVENY